MKYQCNLPHQQNGERKYDFFQWMNKRIGQSSSRKRTIVWQRQPHKFSQPTLYPVIQRGWPLSDVSNLTRMPSLPWECPCLNVGRTLCSQVSIWSPLSGWALCVPVCASTSLGFVQLRRVDKHKLPRVNSSQLDAAGHRPRKLVLAVVLQTARPQCSRRWSDRAVLISEICCPQVQNRGKLLSIWQLQFHLHLLLCYLDNNKHPLSHLQRDVDAVGFTVTGTVSGSWWPLPTGAGPWLCPHSYAEPRLGKEMVKEHPGWKRLQLHPL